jgi:hypothetical protein
MTKEQPISPLIDFCSATSRQQHERGVQQLLHTGDTDNEATHELLPDSYFVNIVKSCVRRPEFDNPFTDPSVKHALCFFLGVLHGCILSPTTGLLRPDVKTLVVLTHQEFARGYNVGRRWYFFDAMPDEERHYTEERVLQEVWDFFADVSEAFVEGADDSDIQYSVGTLLGALSAPLFPATEDEHRQWEAEYRYWMTHAQQERVTEPLILPIPEYV